MLTDIRESLCYEKYGSVKTAQSKELSSYESYTCKAHAIGSFLMLRKRNLGERLGMCDVRVWGEFIRDRGCVFQITFLFVTNNLKFRNKETCFLCSKDIQRFVFTDEKINSSTSSLLNMAALLDDKISSQLSATSTLKNKKPYLIINLKRKIFLHSVMVHVGSSSSQKNYIKYLRVSIETTPERNEENDCPFLKNLSPTVSLALRIFLCKPYISGLYIYLGLIDESNSESVYTIEISEIAAYENLNTR